jgi:hypothetical protein
MHLTITHLGSNWQGLPVIVAGGQVLLLSNLVLLPCRRRHAPAAAHAAPHGRRARPEARRGGGGWEGEPEEVEEEGDEVETHAALAASVLPLHHPDALAALVARGRLPAASMALRQLLGWLRRAAATGAPPAVADADAQPDALPAPASPAGSSQAYQAGPVIEAEAILQQPLHASAGAGALARFREASVRLALGGEVAAEVDAEPVVAAALPAVAAGAAAAPAQQQQPAAGAPLPAVNALETGMLDMSAFGLDDFGAPPPPPLATPPPQPPAPPAVNALETGMLDMSAFGLDDFGAPPPPSPPLQPPATSPPQPPAPAACSALETGVLDMSAFGDFGGFGGGGWDDGRQPAPAPTTAAAAAAPLAAAGSVEVAAAGRAGSLARSSLPLGCDAAMLSAPVDASLLAAVAAPFPRSPRRLGGAAVGPAAAAPPLRALSDAEVAELHALLGVAPLKDPSAGASAGGGEGSAGLAYYRRLLSDAGAAGGGGVSSGAGHRRRSSEAGAAGATPEEAAARAAATRRRAALGLTRRQARELGAVAMALGARTFAAGAAPVGAGPAPAFASALGGLAFGPSASLFRRDPTGLEAAAPGTTVAAADGAPAAGVDISGPALNLDGPGLLLVANVRLALLRAALAGVNGKGGDAAAGEDGEGDDSDSEAGRAAAARDKQRFAAAVARLFQPVSVSRSAASAAGRGAGLLAHYPLAADRGPGASLPPAAPPGAGFGGFAALGARLSRASRASSAASGPPLEGGGLLGGLGGGRSRSRLAARLAGGGAGSAAGGGRSLKSSMSVVSVLSFSSLRDEWAGEAEATARCA